jgi:hypothetical protein
MTSSNRELSSNFDRRGNRELSSNFDRRGGDSDDYKSEELNEKKTKKTQQIRYVCIYIYVYIF